MSGFAYLPASRSWINLAQVVSVDPHFSGNGVTVTTTAADCTESGFPCALAFDLGVADTAALERALREVTVNRLSLPGVQQ